MSSRDADPAENTSEIVKSGQMEFSFNGAANSGDFIDKPVPFSGKVTEVLYGAPAAANNLVGVQIRYDGEKKFPADRESEFIALADVVHDFRTVFEVEGEEEITLHWENKDSADHYINIVLTVTQFADGAGGGA